MGIRLQISFSSAWFFDVKLKRRGDDKKGRGVGRSKRARKKPHFILTKEKCFTPMTP